MISVIVYGRNDSHGYNLHKRAALSINSIAQILDDPEDEILFCDWNTDVGLPTFPEAIADTLTSRARELLRIIEVPAWVHQKRYSHSTHLPTVEPVARNAALVRSNPNNRWVLATNPDMIFIPEHYESLSDIAASLADGFYELPRFNLPESFWESFPRSDPEVVLRDLRGIRDTVDIDQVVTHAPFIAYNAPGDFQLMLREQLLEIGGFDEAMVLGWHIDSNIALRLHALNNKTTKTLADRIRGYHCDHSRVMTNLHGRKKIENDWSVFIEGCKSPYLRYALDEHFGLADLSLREIRLGDGVDPMFLRTLQENAAPPAAKTNVACTDFHRTGWYRASHALPYIVDPLSIEDRSTLVAYAGKNPELLEPLSRTVVDLGFQKLLVWDSLNVDIEAGTDVEFASADRILKEAGFFIADLGMPLATRTLTDSVFFRAWPPSERCAIGQVLRLIDDVCAYDRTRDFEGKARRIVATNVADGIPLDLMVRRHVIANTGRPNARVGVGIVATAALPISPELVRWCVQKFGYEPPADILLDLKRPTRRAIIKDRVQHSARKAKHLLRP